MSKLNRPLNVLIHPRTLPQLSNIAGIGPEKLEKFGPAILALCNA